MKYHFCSRFHTLALASLGSLWMAVPLPAQKSVKPRDPWLWPFATNSIWNTPIGDKALYVPAGLKDATYVDVDTEYFFRVPVGAPERPLYAPGGWEKRATGTAPTGPSPRRSMPLPDDLIVPDARKGWTPNNCSTFLLPDGKSLVQLAPLARVEKGGPIYGYCWEGENLYGSGITGSHGGSGMSAIGGSIRKGELIGEAPIRHAIKVVIWCERYVAYNDDGTRGYRWPAVQADSYAAKSYRGKNPELEIGALLAIPPAVTLESLGLKTAVGKKLFAAFQDYGAYVVDDAAWDAHYLCAEAGVKEEVNTKYGLSLSANSGVLKDDINRLFGALCVVKNNLPTRIGGGGKPRRPLAPPLAAISAMPAEQKTKDRAEQTVATPPKQEDTDPASLPAPEVQDPTVAMHGYFPDYPKAWLAMHNGFVEEAKKGRANIVFLGDSITQGWGGEGKAEWEKRFAPKGAVNFGIGGDRAQQLLWRIQHGTLDGLKPKLVVLKIGVNNLWRDRNTYKSEGVAAGIKKVVGAIWAKCPSAKILVLGILPTQNPADNPLRTHVREINALSAKLDNGKTVRFLDIGKAFEEKDGLLSKEIMPDALHLSAAGYHRFADAIEPMITKLLK